MRRLKEKALLVIAITFFGCVAVQVWEAEAKNSLWRVKGEKNTVYIQGSIHLLKSGNYPLNEAIEQAFDDSEVLALELDAGLMNDPATALQMLTKGTLPEGSTLEESLSAKTYELAKTRTSELGLDIEFFERFKPWFFAVSIEATKLQSLGFSSLHGVDMYFYSKAQKVGKPVVGLETVEFQIGLFDNLSSAEQDNFVYQTLKELDTVEKEIKVIIKAWETGDTGGLEAALLKNFKKYPGLYEIFLSKRNRNWMSKLEEFLKDDKNYMIVVGAAHLVGKTGVIELLKKKGYSIEQM